MKPMLFLPEEAPGKGGYHLPALSVIMRSGGSVAKIVKTVSGGAYLFSNLACVSFRIRPGNEEFQDGACNFL